MTNGSANFRLRQRVAHKIDILLKLQDVLIELLDEDTYYNQWCSMGFPDGATKAELVDSYATVDGEYDLDNVYNLAINLLRECDL